MHNIGGQRIASLQKCDTDFEADAGNWFDNILRQLNGSAATNPAPAPAAIAPRSLPTDPAANPHPAGAAAPRGAGKKIYTGAILTNIDLNDRGSTKRTHHLEIAAEGVEYQPGNSIGIIPENPAAVIEAIIALTGIDPATGISIRPKIGPSPTC